MIKKDKLPRFAGEVSPGGALSEPPEVFKKEGYQKSTSLNPAANYDNYLHQKTYNALKFGRYLSLAKESQKVEQCFGEIEKGGESPYPFVCRGGEPLWDRNAKQVGLSEVYAYVGYDFSSDANEDDLGRLFYPVLGTSSSLSFASLDAEEDYTAHYTYGSMNYDENMTGFQKGPGISAYDSGSLALYVGDQQNEKPSEVLCVFSNVRFLKLSAKDGTGATLGTVNLTLNGGVEGSFDFDTAELNPLTFENLKSVVQADAMEGEIATKGYSLTHFVLKHSSAKDGKNFILEMAGILDNGQSRLCVCGQANLRKNNYTFKKGTNVNFSKQYWGIFLEGGFDADGLERTAYTLKKLESDDFNLLRNRRVLLEQCQKQYPNDVLLHLVTKTKQADSVWYSLASYPLGKRPRLHRVVFESPRARGIGRLELLEKFQGNDNFLEMNGQEVFMGDYPDLFSVVTTRWGQSADTTQFKLGTAEAFGVSGFVWKIRAKDSSFF